MDVSKRIDFDTSIYGGKNPELVSYVDVDLAGDQIKEYCDLFSRRRNEFDF